MKVVKRSVRLNTAALEALKNKQRFLNNFVGINVYNKVFTGVATNLNVSVLGNVVEFEKVISSTNIKIMMISNKNTLAFSNEG